MTSTPASRATAAKIELALRNPAWDRCAIPARTSTEGRLVLMGIAEEDLTLDSKTVFPPLMANRQQIIGSQQNGRQFLSEAVSFAALHGIKPMIETFPLIQAAKAYDRVAQGNIRFRAVLVNA